MKLVKAGAPEGEVFRYEVHLPPNDRWLKNDYRSEVRSAHELEGGPIEPQCPL